MKKAKRKQRIRETFGNRCPHVHIPPSPAEQFVRLHIWTADGELGAVDGPKPGLPNVSIGRVPSKRGLGFEVTGIRAEHGRFRFVLDHEQVENLAVFCTYSLPRLKKSGRRRGLDPEMAIGLTLQLREEHRRRVGRRMAARRRRVKAKPDAQPEAP